MKVWNSPPPNLVHAKMRTRSTLRWGLGPREYADLVHSGTHPRSTRDRYRDRDRTPEHILIFRALLQIEIKIAPVHGQGTLCTSLTTQKNHMGRGQQQMDIATTRPTRPRGPSWWKANNRQNHKQTQRTISIAIYGLNWPRGRLSENLSVTTLHSCSA